MINSLLSTIKSLVALNGVLPSKEFFTSFAHLPLIAADGAGLALLQMGIKPTCIIGDLDSLPGTNLEGIEIKKRDDQNYTDFEKTMAELKVQQLLPSFVVGTAGKELDHTLYNLAVIKRYDLPFLASEAMGRDKMGLFCHTSFSTSLKLGTIISLLPSPEAIVTTKGLVWDVVEKKFNQKEGASIRNRVEKDTISIQVHSGSLLILFDL